MNIGVLDMQTDDTLNVPANNFAVMRVSKELPNRSGIGAMFVNRTERECVTLGRLQSHVWRGRASRCRRVLHHGRLCRAHGDARLTGRDYAYNVDSEYNDSRHRVGFEYGKTGEDFNPEVGFLENEDGYRRILFRFHETMRQQKIRDWGFREWQPHINYTRYDYLDGGLSNADLHIDNHWDWENGYRVDTALNGNWEGFRVPFEIYPGVIVPVGEHGGLFFRMRGNTDARKWISLNGVGGRPLSHWQPEQP